jgi:adenine-specific DNA methylase
MKLAAEVSDEKLRGGFYTPSWLVASCLSRVQAICNGSQSMSMLEPSVGDGAFLRGLIDHPIAQRIERFVGVELVETEAAKARHASCLVPIDSSIRVANAIKWCAETDQMFDIAVGNPPFVRFQFLSADDVAAAELLGRRIGVAFRGVSNLWIPVLLGALSRLKPNGAMAFVVPAELFTGVSAGIARRWLLANFDQLRLDMFDPGSFPGVLQEVVVLSGRRTRPVPDGTTKNVDFVEHVPHQSELSWSHDIPVGQQSWTRRLLTPGQLCALHEATCLPDMVQLGSVARIEVSIVTGANDFFSVSNEEVEIWELFPWVEPLLPRIRCAPGLVYTIADQESVIDSGAKAWLLDFSHERPNPLDAEGATRYLRFGESTGLHLRYKTSIRTPWYRVPSVWSGDLLLSKRSHLYPRLVLNEGGALTTDTIYRGKMRPVYAGRERDLVAGFHNSITMLSAELEGRSFGGGVLELVPSEIARLSVPFPQSLGRHLPELDDLCRSAAAGQESPEILIDRTDEMLLQEVQGVSVKTLDAVRTARRTLKQRRLARN